jgi:type IV secretion system protein TrbL
MQTADSNVLDDFLNKFSTQVDSGFGLIRGDVSAVLTTLVIISITATAILWAIDETNNVLASLVRKVLLVGFFVFLIAQWPTLAKTVVNGFASLGLKAGGGGLTLAAFTTSPSQIVAAGIKVITGLMAYVKTIAPGPVEFFAHLDVVIMAVIAAIGILIAFVVLAVEIVVTIVEFHIVTLVAFVVVPFGVLTQTSFMSERAIGYVVSVGVKVMALALVVSIGTTIFNSYTVSTDPGIGEDVGLLLAAVLMVMLALKVPQIAAALISGGPQLSAGSAAMGAAGVAAGVAGTALAARAIGGAAGNLMGAVTGASQIGSARSAAGALPSARSGGAGDSPSGGTPTGGGPAAPSTPSSGGGAASAEPSSAGGAGPGAAPPPSPAETVASADARESGLTRAVGAAVIAGSQASDGGPGMTATPIRVSEPEA